MQYGICAGAETAAAAKDSGYDYLEAAVGAMLCPEDPEAEFARRRQLFAESGLPVPVCNLFLPGDMAVVGPGQNPARQANFLDHVFARAQRAGVAIIVFGGGRQRSIPKDYPPEDGYRDLLDFAARAAARAAAHGVTLAMEPLNRAETNLLASVAETAAFVDSANHPALRMIVDAFHWAREGETEDDLARAGKRIVHAHIGTRANRLAPGIEPCAELETFFRGLRRAGYDGRVSVEAQIGDPALELPKALAALRRLAAP